MGVGEARQGGGGHEGSETLCTKGISFRSFLQALSREVGVDKVAAVRDAFEGPLAAQQASTGILSTAWYPVAWYREMHRAVQAVVGGGPALASRVSRSATLHDFRGPYRALAAIITPERFVSWSGRLLERYWNGGELRLEDVREGYARAEWTDFEGFNELLWADMMGGTMGVIDACGGHAVRHTFTVTGDSASSEFFWR